jgi:hypothetical protein
MLSKENDRHFNGADKSECSAAAGESVPNDEGDRPIKARQAHNRLPCLIIPKP